MFKMYKLFEIKRTSPFQMCQNWPEKWWSLLHLNSIAEDPVKVGCEETEEEVEMDLVAETPHLPENRVLDGYEDGGEASPEVKEDEDSNK